MNGNRRRDAFEAAQRLASKRNTIIDTIIDLRRKGMTGWPIRVAMRDLSRLRKEPPHEIS